MAAEAQIVDPRGRPVMSEGRRNELTRELRALNHVGRDMLDRLAGRQYDGDRDVRKVAGYPDDYTFKRGKSHYERQHVAGRIIDMPAQATWRNKPTIQEEGSDPEVDTTFEEQWAVLADRLKPFQRWERLDRMLGLGEYAVQVLGFDDVNSKSQLEQPVGGPGTVTTLVFLSEFDETEAEVVSWNENPGSERFGHPEFYDIDFSGDVDGFTFGSQKVHHSRVLHVAESSLGDDFFGRPRLKRVLNLLIDLEKITAATGEAFWQMAAKILVGKVDPDVSTEAFEDHKGDLEEDLGKIINDLKRVFLGHGIELDFLGGETPDPSAAFEMVQTLVASAAGIPKRILFGSERGELASSQDAREWLGRISERHTRFAEPRVVRPFIDRLQGVDVLEDVQYEVAWPNLFEHTEKERAEIDKVRAQTAKAAVEAIFKGGDQALRILAHLIPDLEEILQDEMAELAAFEAEERALEEAEVRRILARNGSRDPEDVDLPDELTDRLPA